MRKVTGNEWESFKAAVWSQKRSAQMILADAMRLMTDGTQVLAYLRLKTLEECLDEMPTEPPKRGKRDAK